MSILQDSFRQMGNNLRRKSVSSASRWAETYRYMGENLWNFDRHPWLREIHDAPEQLIACQKSAQMGVTETAMNRTFYKMDIEKQSILYLLPTTKPDAYDFSNTRFDPALEESPHLAEMFSQNTKNVGVKRSGSEVLYIRGAGSKAGLKSIPVAHIMFDEIDEMDERMVKLAFDRTSGQFGDKSYFMLSTPTVKGKGINLYYEDSTQDHFMFPCPHCGRTTELNIDCLVVTADVHTDPAVRDSYLQCKECKHKLDHEDKKSFLGKGKWESSFTERTYRGFYINQLYSLALRPEEIALYFLETKTDSDFEGEFWNSKMGLPFVSKESAVEAHHVEECKRNYRKVGERLDHNKVYTMGVDVGKVCHVTVCEWETPNLDPQEVSKSSKKRVLHEGTVDNMTQLDIIMDKFDIDQCVIDAMPETRSAIEFANRHPDRVKVCYYNTGPSAKELVIEKGTHKITAGRTQWLDISMSRIRKGTMDLPEDLSYECAQHLVSMYRQVRKDRSGNPVSFWDNSGADHFCHSFLYADVALKVYAYEHGENVDLTDVY